MVVGGAAARPSRSSTPSWCSPRAREFDTAVEINCRPERLDPPERLLAPGDRGGCRFTIDTDAHAPGQLDWQPYGCERAARCGVPESRVVNTLPADDLVAWARSKP